VSRSIYGTGLKGKATKLHSLVVRARGVCERCGERDYSKLQCAHIVPRRYNATRVDPLASWCLCAGCHMDTTAWASEHMDLVERTIGMDAYWDLRRRAHEGVKANDAYWRGWIERLEAEAAA
jgi:hypothetical protein